jgi:omega-amidase
MNIYAVQLDIVWENKHANHVKVRALLESAAPTAGSLVVLPEMFATGFSMNVGTITDSLTHETEEFLAATAQHYGIYLLGGLVTGGPTGRGRNEAVVYSPQGIEVARYQKMQPFTLGGESINYAAGDSPIIFPWEGFTVAPLICYDLRFPEHFRSAVRLGANLYCVIACWPVMREHHWVTLLQARAIENQAYVIGVNRCGNDPTFAYPGRSMIIGPHGQILSDAGRHEGAISGKPDLASLQEWRKVFPALADMRP